jgi:hypothetical protein
MAEEAAAKAVQQVLAAIAQERGEAPAAVAKDGESMDFARGLAMALAEIANQGTGKDVVDPAIIERRSIARRKMVSLIVSARENGIRPEYGLVATVQLMDQLIVPVWVDAARVTHQTCIKWDGVPNEAMEPKDDAAHGIYMAFCESIGKTPGTLARLNPVDRKGNIVTPGGHVFESLPAIPKAYSGGDLEIDPGALADRGLPHNGLEVLGRAPGGMTNREVRIPVLGTVAEPARQLVA